MTVKEARKNGYKVRVSHLRFSNIGGEYLDSLSNKKRQDEEIDWLTHEGEIRAAIRGATPEFIEKFPNYCKSFYPRGGETVVEVTKDGVSAVGFSYCSIKDNYNRKKGVQYALCRALDVWGELNKNTTSGEDP